MSDGRLSTATGRLARLGFRDAEGSAAALDRIGPVAEALAHLSAVAADPDQAVAYLADLADRVDDRAAMLETVAGDEGTAMRLLGVLGASSALGDHLLRHPEQWRDLTDPTLGSTRAAAFHLRTRMLTAVGADPADDRPTATRPDTEAVDAMRVEYRRLLLRRRRNRGHLHPTSPASPRRSDLTDSIGG